jgi:hypothetical protein
MDTWIVKSVGVAATKAYESANRPIRMSKPVCVVVPVRTNEGGVDRPKHVGEKVDLLA